MPFNSRNRKTLSLSHPEKFSSRRRLDSIQPNLPTTAAADDEKKQQKTINFHLGTL